MRHFLKSTFSQTLAQILVLLLVIQPWSLGELSRSSKTAQEVDNPQYRVIDYLDYREAHAGIGTSFGPKKYIRTTGKPNVYTDSFNWTAGPATLTVLNGEPNGKNRLSSALIWINGVQAFAPQDFNQNVYRLERPVSLSQGKNTIRVELRSNPGSYLTLSIVPATLNNPPTADAGPDQTVYVSQTVTLDGSKSSDVDGDPLTFNWSFVSVPAGGSATLSSSTSVKPTFVVDRPGSYTLRLIVNDGQANSAPDTVVINTTNSAPVANAGPDQTTFVQQTVTLDGSKSSDVDGNPLTFNWSFVSRPPGSIATLQNPTSVNPTFVPDKFGDYVVQLIVNDGLLDSLADTVKVSTLNSAPIANAGANQSAFVGDQIVLDGSGSTDIDGNLLTFSWSFVSKPLGSNTTLQNPTSVNPSFVIDQFGDYVIQLIVNDGTVNSKPATVTVSTLNSPPVANAGPGQLVFVGDTVQLNGSASTDVDGNLLTFTWSLTSTPLGSAANLSDPTAVNPTFIVDLPGTYIAQLVVNDGIVNSVPHTVTISTQNRPPVANAGPDQTVQLQATVQLDGSFSSDPDGDPFSVSWSILSTPTGSAAILSDPNAINPSFVADLPGNYVGQLIVNDGNVNSPPDTVAISTENSIPIANAGPDQTVFVGASIQLDGSQSYDPDGSSLFYFWSFTTQPQGSNAALSDPALADPTFVADLAGTYVAQLIVGDGLLVSPPDTAMITANAAPPVNLSPIANDDSALTAQNTAVQIFVLANDSDPDGDTITISDVTQGINGGVAQNGSSATYTPNTGFNGIDTFTYTSSDGRGGFATANVTVTVDQPPQVNAGPNQTITLPVNAALAGIVTDDGLPNPPAAVTIAWSLLAGPGTVSFGNVNAASTTASFSQAGTYILRLSADDGFLSASDDVTITVNPAAGGGGLPPDPTTVAPPLDPSVTSTIGKGTEFLYTGPNPIQTGVAPGTINPIRAAVLRGKVLDRNDAPLPGVTITILNHPEFGQTLSRADGMFDMAVNGGGLLTVNYQKAGFLAAQRAIVAPWRDYAWLPDVVLIPFDTTVTAVDLNVAAMQVARGSAVSDADGARRATILFPPGTTATMVLPDGTTQPLTTLNVRATEYTVGASGSKAMPALLPPSSGYTYAAEFSVDEAVAAGATDVRFSQSLPVYVENFLGFPVGGAVPTGYYDRQKGQWIASANGRVVKVLSITGGLADLDLDGNGAADGAAPLAALGVTVEERTHLAQLYTPGQTLWRVPITHFTPWDCNWPYGPPSDSVPPPVRIQNNPPVDNPNEECGSVIGCENQTLGESVSVTGTPWRLHYRSQRTPGRKDAYTLKIPVSGVTIPASLRAMRVEVSIAGRLYQAAFAPAPNLTYTVTWDGKDGYGRPLQGAQLAVVHVHYDYAPQYYSVPSAFANSFARAEAAGSAVSGTRGASTINLSKTWAEPVGTWDARASGLGGWSLSVQHAYDASSQTLLLGDGRQRRAEALPLTITTVAGSGVQGFFGDGGPATAARLSGPWGVAVGPDGSLYIADNANHRIRRVGPNGIITTVAGSGVQGFFGDGGPATAARLNGPFGVAVGPDGSLYIADNANHRIRRVGPNGIITTVAGSGLTFGFAGDGGPATVALLAGPSGVAVGPDGSLYIADGGNYRIRRVGPDGIITTVAGSGVFVFSGGLGGFGGDGGPATAARLATPSGVAVGPDGSLYIADRYNHRIRRVGPDGIITTVAGSGVSGVIGGFGGDGGPATAARLFQPFGVAVGPDGILDIADAGNNRIRRVGPDGIIITTVAGNGTAGFGGDGGPATAAQLNGPVSVTVGPDGSRYIADVVNNRIRRVAPALPGFSVTDVLLSSEDGREVYVFDSAGRHLKTLDALTGAVRYQFGYDANGYLISITDGSGNVTTIARTGAAPSAIVAPGGQRTTFTVNANGYLATVANPAGNTHTMSYSADGLMQSFSDPLGHMHSFTYDALGRLVNDQDPAAGSISLARTEQSTGYTVTTASSLGRVRTYQVERLSTGALRRTVTQPSGAQTVTVIGTDGSEQATYPDGSSSTVQYGPDPRWGMLAPVATSRIFTNPGGLTRTVTTTRTATLSNVSNLFSLTNLTETVTDNGAVSTHVYDGITRLFTSTTPAGRSGALNLDAQGRIIQSQLTGLAPVGFVYDSTGLLSAVTEGSGPTSRSTSLAYNGARYLSGVSDALGRSVSFTYDLAGRLVGTTLPNGQIIQQGYDAAGNATAITPPGRPAHGFAYSPINQMSSYTPPDVGIGSTATQYSYNTDRALTNITRPGGQLLDLTYDAAGRMSTLDFAAGQLSFTYSPSTGQLTNINAPGGIGQSYSYNGALLTGVTWTGPAPGALAYTYDNNFRVTAETVNGANSVSFGYDADGLVATAGALSLTRNPQNGLLTGSALGGVTDSSIYNNLGKLTDYSAAYSGSGIYSASYVRDALSRITQTTETVNGVATVFNYSFDLASRLVEVKTNGSTTAAYTYDGNGNRLTGPGGVNGTYDNQDRLLSYGSTTYSHSANGELLSKTAGGQTAAYQYDALGNLRTVTLPGGMVIDYLIDGRNRRIGKKVNATLVQAFLYQGALRPAAELDGAGNVVSRFVYATRRNVPDYMIKGGVTYRVITDHLGSPRLVVNTADGSIAQRMVYDEWGNVTLDDNPGFQPFGFAGGLYDPDTKLVRFGARDYDAETGRWTAKDPILFAGGDTGLYGYVLNDPVNLIDPTGTDGFLHAIGKLLGRIFSHGAASTTTTAVQGEHVNVTEEVISAVVEVPAVPSAGPVAGYLLTHPETVYDYANAVNAISNPGARAERAARCGD